MPASLSPGGAESVQRAARSSVQERPALHTGGDKCDLTVTGANALSMGLSPRGHLLLWPVEGGEQGLDAAAQARIAPAFERGMGAGLLHLGAVEVSTALPASAGFWRDFARKFVAAVCAVPDLETLRDRIALSPEGDLLRQTLHDAPPMKGGEYLTVEVLEAVWAELLEAFRAEVRADPQSVQLLLAAKNPVWNIVGRVFFHLAENKQNPERPFAFLASYTAGVSAQGKPQHRPLGEAVRASSSAGDKQRLMALLVPLQKASQRSPFLKELVDSRQAFDPQAWTPSQAHRFLQDIPAFEEGGVMVRVPDWWKSRRPPRPQVSVSIGKKAPSTLGLDAMLDFTVSVTLDGERLSPADLKILASAADGLLLLKGKWVEVDRARLDEVLAHWKKVEASSDGSLSFIDGMRLMAGARLGDSPVLEAEKSWLGVEAGPWLQQAFGSLRSAEVDPGPLLEAQLRPYQLDGVRWLHFLSRLRLGACLADDMGLGKTIQVLALLLVLKQRQELKGPHLLVVPASLIANWKAEAERFAPSLRLLIAHPSATPAKELAALSEASLEKVDLVVTSYGSAQRLAWVAQRRWGLVVLDEAQAIKNPGTGQARLVKALKCEGRVALTGTPVENRVGDLWSIFDFLNPGLLGSAKQFTAFTKKSDSYGPLRELARPYLLRRLKTDKSIISDLPEKTELRAFCSLTQQQAALYQHAVDQLAGKLKVADGIARRGLVLAFLMRFKQICNHPSQWLGDGGWDEADSGKFARLKELCETIAERQEKALIFTQFREMTAPLAGWVGKLFGRPGLVLTGETPVKQRGVLVKQFQEDEQVPFFVLSLKAGGTGLNLTAASHVIHFDRWWNPAVENQATDRAFRIGQKKNVIVHKLVCRGTIEERIDAMIESKQGIARQLLEGTEELKLTELNDAELLKLVALDIHTARAES